MTSHRDVERGGYARWHCLLCRGRREGLTTSGQKKLTPKYLYDALGSAYSKRLLQLPEYVFGGPERTLLSRDMREEIAGSRQHTKSSKLGSGGQQDHSSAPSALAAAALSYWTSMFRGRNRHDTARAGRLTRPATARCRKRIHAGLETALHARVASERALVLFLRHSLETRRLSSSLFLQRVRSCAASGDALFTRRRFGETARSALAATDDALV